MKRKLKQHSISGPLLDTAQLNFAPTTDFSQYPFSLPLIKNLQEIAFPSQVTFFVGENGTGKSTLLEAFALKAGFGAEGGNKNIQFKTADEKTYTGTEQLADTMTFSWRKKALYGYFFRAESFFNVANYIDYIAREGGEGPRAYDPYGGKSLHEQSHGESFLAFFKNQLRTQGFFILDEPEAALSPQRQLSLLALIHEACTHYQAQCIIATHSPILLAYPHATIYSCDGNRLKTLPYHDTNQNP